MAKAGGYIRTRTQKLDQNPRSRKLIARVPFPIDVVSQHMFVKVLHYCIFCSKGLILVGFGMSLCSPPFPFSPSLLPVLFAIISGRL